MIGQFLTTKEEIENDPVQVLPILQAYEERNKEFIKFVWDNTIYTFKKPEEERYQRYLDEILMQRNLVDIDYSLVHFNISHEHNGAEEGTGEVDKITQPALVIQGEDDLVVPKQMGVEMAQSIGDNAKLALLTNGGHAPMEDDIDRFMNVLLDFLA
jgi:pimeloyl-ACP methyl ester carboxylesterase